MKTAMQELIDELESIKGYKYGGLVIRLMKEKLEKEKEQIIRAFKSSRDIQDSDDISITYDWFNAIDYYNQTYNQNK